MPVKSQILFNLYQRLKSSPCSMAHLRQWKEANGFDVSDRTIYRYLHELNFLLADRQDEILELIHGDNRRKLWQISPRFSASGETSKVRHQESGAQERFGRDHIDHSANTGLRDLLLSAISGQSKLQVHQGIPPSECNLRQDDRLWPLQLIRHNGADYTCFFNERSGSMQAIAVDMLPILRLEGTLFNRNFVHAQLSDWLNDHFGLADNIDEHIYIIDLLIDESRVCDVTTRRWHNSQSLETVPGGRMRMKMNCGINSELIAWILGFGNKMQVIGPEVLVTEVVRQLNETMALYREPGKGLLQIAS